jgi:hypothetical protein
MRTVLRPLLLAAAAIALATPAQAFVYDFSALLSGSAESPPNASPGTGTAFVTFDTDLHTMRVQVTFSGLVAGVTASHIHAATAVPLTGTAGVATTTPTFTGFPGGVTAGTYDHTFDMTLATSYNGSYITAHGGTTAQAEADLLAAMLDQRSYLNIHSTAFPGGEIRGFLTAVPDAASTLGLMSMGLVALSGLRKFRK